jgi:hypothetical protein
MGKWKVGTILVVVLLLVAAPAMAGNWYIGGGLESVAVEIEGSNFIDDGSGFTFSFGYQYTPSLALDFLWGASNHTENGLGGDVGYGRLVIAPKFILTASEQFKPYATIGLISNAILFEMPIDDITGVGLFLGFGADFFINPGHSIGIGFRGSSWTGEDSVFKYDMDTSVMSVVYNYHFIM